MNHNTSDPARGPASGPVEVRPFQVHLPGLLHLLGTHLYSDRRVALREILQNAHDSCVRRRTEDPDCRGGTPRIAVTRDVERGDLVVADEGSGLTREEIVDFLATLGRSYTASLRERLAGQGLVVERELVGQFGLGFLAAFLVSRSVELVTRSYRAGAGCWRFRSHGDGAFSLEPAERATTGTTVRLSLRDEYRILLTRNELEGTIRAMADLLPTPIFLDGGPEPVNAIAAPWERPGTDEGLAREVERRFGVPAPLAVIRLADHRAIDGRVLPLAGLLWIPCRSRSSVGEYGNVTLHVRRMFVTDRERDLLPSWARFVSGVIDTPVLSPTASRESVCRDEAFTEIGRALEAQLLGAIRTIARDDPDRWASIVSAHEELIRLWSPQSVVLFDQVADLVPVPTTRGPMTMPAYLGLTRGEVHLIQEDDEVHLASLLLESQGSVAIDARYVGVSGFVRSYAARRGLPAVQPVRSDLGAMLSPVQDPDGVWSALLLRFAELGADPSLAAFAPVEIPAIQVFPELAAQVERAGQALANGKLPAGVIALFRGALAEQARRPEAHARLYLNARCALMQRLRANAGARSDLRPLLEAVVAAGRILSGRPLTGQDALATVGSLASAIGAIAGATLADAPVHPLDLVLEGCPRERARAVADRWPTWCALAVASREELALETGTSGEKLVAILDAARRR